MIAVAGDPLLGFTLPADDPTPYARTADSLVTAADRVGVLLRRVAAMLPVAAWSGVASVAADRRLGDTGLALAQERTRLLGGADALVRFSGRVALASELSAAARRLVTAARDAQQQADLRDPTAALTRSVGWGGRRADGGLYDPAAVGLLHRARLRAHEARSTYDAAARRLTADLTEISGRRVVRAGPSPRLLLDVVGLVPVIGDAVDLGNAAAYALQGRWGDASLTAVAAVPGPEGWAVASAKLGRALGRAGEVAKLVDDVPAEQRVAEVLAGLQRGRRRDTRVLPDDDAVTRLYREAFHPLGTTRLRQGSRGDVLVTRLPGGGRVSYRSWSNCGGATIDFADVAGVDVKRIHRGDC